MKNSLLVLQGKKPVKKAISLLEWAGILAALAGGMYLCWITILGKTPLMDFVHAVMN